MSLPNGITSSSEDNGINSIYDQMSLKSDHLGHDTITEKWPRVCGIINKLSLDHIKIIFLLILHHGIQENPKIVDSIVPSLKGKSRQIQLPYYGRVLDSGKGAIYKISSLPEKLQKIIYCYIEVISE